MMLQTATKGLYMAHFHHGTKADAPKFIGATPTDIDRLWDKFTCCFVHNGNCRISSNGKACESVSIGAVTFCSTKDNFRKAKGRKIAFTRAISHLPKDVRAELWAAYPNKEAA